MTKEHFAIFLAMTLMAIGAVAVVLWHHANATQSVLAALGNGASNGQGSPQTAALGSPASLAGMPTVGQSGLVPVPSSVNSLQISGGGLLQ